MSKLPVFGNSGQTNTQQRWGESPEARPATLAPGSYRLYQPFFQDGEMVAYKAKNAEGRVVAVFRSRSAGTDEDSWVRFRREVSQWKDADHPNLVAVLGCGRTAERVFFATELPDGMSLRQHLAKSGALPPAEAVRLTVCLAEALRGLHRAGVLHRRVRPATVRVNRHGRVILLPPRLAWWGDEDPQWLASEPGLETLVYMAPEQIRDGERSADPRSDVYALAATLYTLVSGRPPFEPEGRQQCLREKEAWRFEAAAGNLSGLGEGVWDVIRRGLAPNPEDRFSCLDELIAPLEPELEGMGRYTLLERIGRGESGTVWRARRDDGRVVALKILHREVAGEERRILRFYQEAKLSMQVDHPNLVQALEVGEHQGRHFIAMDYVEGENLARYVMRRGKLDEPEALRITADVAQALAAVHQQGILHRDVNPNNLLVTRNGRALLTDLGLSKQVEFDLGLTAAGTGLGTAHYMAPEQFCDAKNVGPRADIYGLGTTLYTMLTGKLPFSGQADMTMLAAKFRENYRPPEEINPQISVRTARLIRQALRGDPGKRPRNARQMAQMATSYREALDWLHASPADAPKTPAASQPPAPAGASLGEFPSPHQESPADAAPPMPAAVPLHRRFTRRRRKTSPWSGTPRRLASWLPLRRVAAGIGLLGAAWILGAILVAH